MERRPELRRSMTLSEQLATPDPAIREFLKIPNDGLYGEDGRSAEDGGDSSVMSNWKPLRDRLRLRRTVNAWPTPSQKPATTTNSRSHKYIYAQGEATAAFSRTASVRQTPTFTRAASTRVGPTASFGSTGHAATHDDDDDEEEEEASEPDDEEEEGKDDAPAAQMSLMALLEQTDSQWDDDEEEEEDNHARGGASKDAHVEDEEDDGEEMVHVCCVCMVRHKGASSTPCGHTFCRLCSRELWVSRGNCPLCNGFIQEILDIF